MRDTDNSLSYSHDNYGRRNKWEMRIGIDTSVERTFIVKTEGLMFNLRSGETVPFFTVCFIDFPLIYWLLFMTFDTLQIFPSIAKKNASCDYVNHRVEAPTSLSNSFSNQLENA